MTLKKNKKKREQRDKIESQFEFIRIYLNGWKKKKDIEPESSGTDICTHKLCTLMRLVENIRRHVSLLLLRRHVSTHV